MKPEITHHLQLSFNCKLHLLTVPMPFNYGGLCCVVTNTPALLGGSLTLWGLQAIHFPIPKMGTGNPCSLCPLWQLRKYQCEGSGQTKCPCEGHCSPAPQEGHFHLAHLLASLRSHCDRLFQGQPKEADVTARTAGAHFQPGQAWAFLEQPSPA